MQQVQGTFQRPKQPARGGRKELPPLIPPNPLRQQLDHALKEQICERRAKQQLDGEQDAVFWWSEGGGKRLGRLKLTNAEELANVRSLLAAKPTPVMRHQARAPTFRPPQGFPALAEPAALPATSVLSTIDVFGRRRMPRRRCLPFSMSRYK